MTFSHEEQRDIDANAQYGGTEKPYSVLLMYPDYLNYEYTDTFYDHVIARDSLHAIEVAQRNAAKANDLEEDGRDPGDFSPLLVIEGHHHGQPIE